MAKITTSWDRILASTPADVKAAVVVSRGEAWAPTIIDTARNVRSEDGPLPTKPAPPDAPNIIGLRCGRLTVIGLAAEGKRWVVRCSCGAYEHRKAGKLQDPHYAPRAMCSHCDRLEQIKAGFADSPAEALAHRDAKRAARAAR